MPALPFAISTSRLSPRRWSSPEPSGAREASRAYPADYAEVFEPVFAPRAGWLSASLQRLSDLESLEAGWDDGDAQPVASSLISAVREFINSPVVSSLTVQPDIVPTLRGGLLIEWHTASIDLVIETASAGSPSFYFLDNETGEEVEAPIGQRVDAIATAFTKLAS